MNGGSIILRPDNTFHGGWHVAVHNLSAPEVLAEAEIYEFQGNYELTGTGIVLRHGGDRVDPGHPERRLAAGGRRHAHLRRRFYRALRVPPAQQGLRVRECVSA
jgi:hypothetical protein